MRRLLQWFNESERRLFSCNNNTEKTGNSSVDNKLNSSEIKQTYK